ncbi:MAG TPA: hypothetical protein VL172_18045, partial [Kofleriaceae bacterium]|nr:hypothetical protein [Kofleriaceae bacterium]
ALAGAARAEPRFAVREGARCSLCHVNQTGGGMRTPFGASFAQTNLAMVRTRGVFDPRLGESVSLGANLRLANRTLLPAHTSLDGVDRKTRTHNSFDITEGNLYLLAAASDRLAVYFDETVTPEAASSREAFLLVHDLPHGAWVKAGRFMLDYGLRIPDDQAFIRGQTGFNYANADLGLEAGIAPGPVQLVVALTNGSLGGSDPNRAKQVTAHATVTSGHAQAGLGLAWNDTSAEDFTFQQITAGGHLAGRLGRLVLLGELDWIRGDSGTDAYQQWALYSEADFEARQGLFVRAGFEAFDPLRSLAENERDRFRVGVSWFAMQLVELRAEYWLNRDIPQRVDGNADALIVEVNGYL